MKYEITKAQIDTILGYLVRCPYADVANLVQLLTSLPVLSQPLPDASK